MKQLTSRTNGLKKIARNATFNTRLMVANGVFMSKVMYLMTVWGGAQQYLLKGLQVQQPGLCVASSVEAGPKQKTKLLYKVGWLSIRQLIYMHTVLQAHKTISSGKPALLHQSISSDYPYRTRRAAAGHIRFGETFSGDSSLILASFKHRAVHWYNDVPVSVKTGSQISVKNNLRKWVKQNVPLDWG